MCHTLRSLWLLLIPTAIPAQSVIWFHDPALQSVGGRIPVAASPLSTATPLATPNTASSLQWLYLGDRRIRFFDGPQGGGKEFTPTGASGTVPDLAIVDFDDLASSYSVFDADTRAGWIQLHENAPTSAPGQQAFRFVSEYAPRVVHSLTALHANDRASAIAWDLPPGVAMTVHEHADGTGRELTLIDSGTEQGLGAHRLDDRISALRWRSIDPARGFLTLYEDKHFGGPRVDRYLSEQTLNWRTSLGSASFDNVASSVIWDVPPGESLLLYDSADGTGKGGAAVVLSGRGQCEDLGRWALDDRVSAFELRTGDLMADHSDRDRPYDENTHLLAHDAHASTATGVPTASQELDVPQLLDWGVRAFEVDTEMTNGEVTVGTTGETLDDLFARIFSWHVEHPRSLITLVLDHRDDPSRASGLEGYLGASPFRDRIATAPIGPWPTPKQLVDADTPLVVLRRGPGSPRVASLHDAAVENTVTPPASVLPAPGSAPIDGLHRSVLVMHHHPAGSPSQATAGFFSAFHEKSDLLAIARSFEQTPNLVSLTWAHEGAGGGPLGAVRELNADWRTRAPSSPKFMTYGSGCTGDLWALTPPTQGTVFSLRVTGALPGDLVAALLGSGPASLALGNWGLVPCQVGVTPILAIPTTGGGTLDLPIPLTASWIGASLFTQGLFAGPAGIRSTRSGYARIG